ncbi:hypothetical protein [Mesorhizobium sp. ORM8.1]
MDAFEIDTPAKQPVDNSMEGTSRQARTFIDDGVARCRVSAPVADEIRLGGDVPAKRMSDRTNADGRWCTKSSGHHGSKPETNAADADDAGVRAERRPMRRGKISFGIERIVRVAFGGACGDLAPAIQPGHHLW